MKGLKYVREQHGISQEQLASMLGIDRSTVTKWETGDSYPRGEILTKLADTLHCTIDELFGRGAGGGTERNSA